MRLAVLIGKNPAKHPIKGTNSACSFFPSILEDTEDDLQDMLADKIINKLLSFYKSMKDEKHFPQHHKKTESRF